MLFISFCSKICQYINSKKQLCLIVLFVIAFVPLLQMFNQNIEIYGIVSDSTSFLRRTRNLADYISPDNDTCLSCTYLIKQCNNNLEIEKIIYFVTSSPSNRERRYAIRDTWGQHLNPRPIFLIGKTDDLTDMNLLFNESKLYQDIIIEDFIDSYSNLTIKTGYILKHFLQLCPKGKYLMKTDDDMFVNTKVIDNIISKINQNKLIGKQVELTKPHRDRESKFYLPYWLYSNFYLPTYLAGTGYLIPGSLVSNIYGGALKVPIIPLEDVFLTGLVANEYLGYSFHHDSRFKENKPMFDNYCLYEQLATAHRITPHLLRRIWSEIVTRPNNCDSYAFETIRSLNDLFD